MKRLALIVAAAFASVMLTAASDDPADHLKDAGQESRAESLFGEIRCVVCQNESIAASEADIAHDMRMLVRGQIAAGKTDQDVRDYMYARYGDYILLRPRLTLGTAILWGAPFVIVLSGLGLLLARRRRILPLEGELSASELAALKRLETEPQDPGAS